MVGGDDLLRARAAAGRDPVAGLFPKQRAFFDDPAKLKAAVCGRRAGKTEDCAAGLYDAARRHPKSLNPYISLSQVSARRIMWPVLSGMNDRYRLGMRLDTNTLTATLDNGSQIFCVGGDDHRKVEALRGAPYPRVVIDEAGSFPRTLLRYLCEDVLDAALMDHDGDMWLVGTPNAACVGHFYDLTTGKNPEVAKIHTHHWTVLDNPYIPHAADWLARKRVDKGWSLDHPTYQREYMGLWVRDASSLVFRFDRGRNLVASDLVPNALRGCMGVDLGTSETERSMAFVVNMWAKYNRTVYTVRASKHGGMSPQTGGDELARLVGLHPQVDTVVVDEGGLGKGFADDWRMRASTEWAGARGKFPGIKAAQKRDKLAYVEFMNGELDRQRVMLADCPEVRPLLEEIELLQWNEDRDGYDDRFADHSADAWLYSWRECYAWSEGMAPTDGPKPGTREWEMAAAAKAKEKAISEAARRAARENRRLYR